MLKENNPISLSTSVPMTYPLPSKVNKIGLGTEVWMEFDEFFKCFRYILLYISEFSYINSLKYSI